MPPWRTPKSPEASEQRYFELYKLAVEMADRVSARRAIANNYFATLHAAVASAVGLVPPIFASETDEAAWVGRTIGATAGLLLAAAWWLTLRSYRYLNGAKFKVILEMEKRLPAGIYGDEWAHLKSVGQGWRDRYQTLSESERRVPILFGILYLTIIVWPAPMYFCQMLGINGR